MPTYRWLAEQVVVHCVADQRDPGIDTQPGVNVLQVSGHRTRADHRIDGRSRRCSALRDQPYDLCARSTHTPCRSARPRCVHSSSEPGDEGPARFRTWSSGAWICVRRSPCWRILGARWVLECRDLVNRPHPNPFDGGSAGAIPGRPGITCDQDPNPRPGGSVGPRWSRAATRSRRGHPAGSWIVRVGRVVQVPDTPDLGRGCLRQRPSVAGRRRWPVGTLGGWTAAGRLPCS
jgi:hypothetical protein